MTCGIYDDDHVDSFDDEPIYKNYPKKSSAAIFWSNHAGDDYEK